MWPGVLLNILHSNCPGCDLDWRKMVLAPDSTYVYCTKPENSVLTPPALRRGSKIRIIAPSGPFDRALFWRAIGWISEFYCPSYDREIFNREGFLAGSDERRRRELQLAIDHPEIAAIVVARGGWGAARFTSGVDFRGLISHPKWIVGYSDPTTLHVCAWQVGVASMHANNLVSLGRADADARRAWLEALEHPDKCRILVGKPVCGGKASGVLVGGNLTVLFSCLAAGKLCFPDNCILALEDIGESSYRVDRMLDALVSSGSLDKVAGFALGQFVGCDDGKFGVSVDKVLFNQLRKAGVPVVAALPFGHARINVPLPFGTRVTLNGSQGELLLGNMQ